MYRLLRAFFSFLDCFSASCSFPPSLRSLSPHLRSLGGLVGRVPPVFGVIPNEDVSFTTLAATVCFLGPLFPLLCCSSLVSVPFSPHIVTVIERSVRSRDHHVLAHIPCLFRGCSSSAFPATTYAHKKIKLNWQSVAEFSLL